MGDIEATFRSFVTCLNEKRWNDLPQYATLPFTKDGEQFTPQSYAAWAGSVGEFELTVDSVTVDREANQLASTVLVKFKPEGAVMGLEPTGSAISFVEQHINWFSGGKLSQTLILGDRDEIIRRLSDPQSSSTTPDLLIRGEWGRVSGKTLSTLELKQTYRAYIDCINAQTLDADSLAKFCHLRVVHNAKTLSVLEYGLLIQEAFTAIPDIVFELHSVVADERRQRVAARIEFRGTPVGPMAGAKANGRSVEFCEHVTYQLMDGKIARVWSIVDWVSYRRQLSEKEESFWEEK
ncbi:SnoaL-domain-containing protein [Camillea tinctor]|nr:SnoaL-domain-containing protein [Camillea tinctor]